MLTRTKAGSKKRKLSIDILLLHYYHTVQIYEALECTGQ